MAPNVDVTPGHTFLNASRGLIETAYANGGNRRVYLLSHSNGGPMAQALLLAQPQWWRDKHVAGLVSYAGNWAGQGSFVQFLFTGLSFTDYSTWRPEAAEVMQTWPAVYFSMAQPKVYGNSEVIIAADNKTYTPADYDVRREKGGQRRGWVDERTGTEQWEGFWGLQALFADAGLVQAAKLFPLFNGVVQPSQPPHVHVYSFYGTKLKTQVGSELPHLRQGVIPTGKIYLEGDGDQESADNESNLKWKELMRCHHFEAIEMEGTSHLLLPFTLQAMQQTMEIVQTERIGPCLREEVQAGLETAAHIRAKLEAAAENAWGQIGRRGGARLSRGDDEGQVTGRYPFRREAVV